MDKAEGGKMSKLLTISEASELTRLTVKTLYSKVCRREVPFTKLGGKLLFDEDRLRKWIDEHSVEPVAVAG
jgi:excisionase family DNA binding protein